MRKKKQKVFLYILSLKWLFAAPVLFYKKCISPIIPSRCPYFPSCSGYMLDCVQKHGVKGVLFGIKRLIRCNPLTKGGYDPVPFRKGDYKWLY